MQLSADYHAGWPLCKLWEHRFSVPDLVSSPPPSGLTGLLETAAAGALPCRGYSDFTSLLVRPEHIPGGDSALSWLLTYLVPRSLVDEAVNKRSGYEISFSPDEIEVFYISCMIHPSKTKPVHRLRFFLACENQHEGREKVHFPVSLGCLLDKSTGDKSA